MGKIDNIDFDNLPLPGENFERIAHTRPTDSEATHIKTARPRTRLNGPGFSDVTTAVDSEDLETDEKKYDLKLNVDALERITGDGSPSSENLRKEVDRFVRICQNQKIDEFVFGVYRGAIDSIGAMGEVTDEKGENVTERASLKLSVFTWYQRAFRFTSWQ
ncbi:MAG: hypothetical protein NT162_00490 [Candidatus Woesebacteria bacterium]|nr:hypothetical protein [Candidatus Woesebacteria bacterium]